ncbi:MFS transporter [Candidatus Lokiarchaeum ossiferum]|uniref:MFS transporter n=1 Tax=Candidatus Lokiarchaeum ossiferum TaxID=2951803 RepID=UPI00352E07BC
MSVQETSNLLLIDDKVSIKTKIAFGLSGASSSVMEGMVFGSITYFYNVKLLLDGGLIGIAWIIFGFWNALNDPILGIMQEKTQSKLGRRIPYIRYGSLFFGALFILSWIPLFGRSETALFINFILVLFLFDTIFTLVGLVNYSLPAEMAMTAKSRASISAYTTILGAIGVLISMVVPMILFTEGRDLPPSFYPTIIIIGLASTLIMFVSSFFLKENQYAQQEETLGFFESIKWCLKNKPFLINEVNFFFFQIAYTILTSAIFYYVDFVLELGGDQSFYPVIAVFITIFIAAGFISTKVEKWGLKKIYIGCLLFSGVMFFIAYFVGSYFIPGVIMMALIGFGIGGRMVTEGVIMADIIDFDETQTGKRRETTYAGVNALFIKPAISIGNWLYLKIFGVYGFNPESAVQGPDVKDGILLGFFLIPGIIMLISALAMKFYPLDGPEWKKKKIEMQLIHQQKEKDFLSSLKK